MKKFLLRLLLWLWDVSFMRGEAGTNLWPDLSRAQHRLIVWDTWRRVRLGAAICFVIRHDWGWGREYRTGLVMTDVQTCGRCWFHRKTPSGIQRAKLYIEDDEREDLNVLLDAYERAQREAEVGR